MRAEGHQLVAGSGADGRLWPDVEPAPPASTLWDAVEGAATSAAGISFVDAALNERYVDYGELCELAVRAAGALRERGLEPGDRVGIVGLTSAELVATLLACWRADLVPTLAPLPRAADSSNWLGALGARLDVIGAAALLADSQFAGLVEPVLGSDRTHELGGLLAGPPLQEPTTATPHDIAYLQFTSGSTGASRAAAIGHTQILWNACHDFNHTGHLGADDPRASWLPLYHDFGLVSSLAGLFAGAPLILQSPEQFLLRPSSWMDFCSRYQAAFTAAPNSGFGVAARDMILNPRDLDLSNLRVIINGSEPIDMETIDRFVEAGGRYGMPATAPSAAYGMAEVTLAITWTRPEDMLESVYVDREGLGERGGHVRRLDPGAPGAVRLACCGRPDDATEIRVLDAAGDPLPDWRVGEIVIRGPSVMQGYLNDPEATAEVLRDGWLITGDLGFHVGGRELVLCGRIKDMIIVAGRNLYPQDFEFVAERVPGVRKGNAVAFSIPGTERMVVVLEVKDAEQSAAVARGVQERLREEFDITPPEVVVVEAGSVPKTSSGKRRRGACRGMYETGELPVIASAGA